MPHTTIPYVTPFSNEMMTPTTMTGKLNKRDPLIDIFSSFFLNRSFYPPGSIAMSCFDSFKLRESVLDSVHLPLQSIDSII